MNVCPLCGCTIPDDVALCIDCAWVDPIEDDDRRRDADALFWASGGF